jgi:hypothetical protein
MSVSQSGTMGAWPHFEETYLDLEEHPSLEGERPRDTRHRPVPGRKAVLWRESLSASRTFKRGILRPQEPLTTAILIVRHSRMSVLACASPVRSQWGSPRRSANAT